MAHSFIDKFGYRRQRANPISRVGVFPYTGEQIDQPKRNPITGEKIVKKNPVTGEIVYRRNERTGEFLKDETGRKIPEYEMQFGLEPKKLYPVLRGPDALFDPEAIESFNGLPIKIGHLMLGDKSQNKGDKDKQLSSVDDNPIDGCIYNVRPSMDEPGYLIAEFCIYTDRMKDVLKEGKVKELSLGYTCMYEPENGVYEGVPYMFKQTNLRGNHLALVKRGRCGSSVCVCDEAVITFDSLPEGVTLMENTEKKETSQLDRAKALASAIKGGDEQLAQDCLDFADFPPEVRKEALKRCKAGKNEEKEEGEKEVEDKATKKAAKDDAPGDAPVPPPAESPAPETAAASAETPEPPPPPADVPSPKDGEMPAPTKDCEDKAPKGEEVVKGEEIVVCDKCGKAPCECKEEKPAQDCGAKVAKDCNQPVTEPTAQVPVAALADAPEKKDAEAKDCKDKAPKGAETVVLKDKSAKEVEKDAAPGQNSDTATMVVKSAMIKSLDPKVAQDEYAAFINEYLEAQSLANKLRPFIKETFDSAPMRVVDVARFAAKHIDNLAFVMDEADDEKVLTAVRGYAAAVAMDAAPKKEAVFEDAIKSTAVIAQDEMPSKSCDSKDLLAYLAK